MTDRSLAAVLRAARTAGRAALLADVKLRSPRDGQLIRPERLEEYVAALLDGGADALATPTDPVHFGGGLDVARRIRQVSPLPLLRKDFFRSVTQIDESWPAGFDAVQLSLRTIADPELVSALRARAAKRGLEVVLGVHTADEIRFAVGSGATMLGVNNRDITALEQDNGSVARAESLLPLVPPEVLVIVESGVREPRDVARAVAAGADGVLVGTVLARSDDPAATLAGLCRAAGRRPD